MTQSIRDRLRDEVLNVGMRGPEWRDICRAAEAAIEELCDALHKALEWPISAEESDRLWQVLWKYGEGPPAIADRSTEPVSRLGQSECHG